MSERRTTIELRVKAQADFLRNFGNGEEPIVTVELIGNEEMIVVETKAVKAYYNIVDQKGMLRVELKSVQKQERQ